MTENRVQVSIKEDNGTIWVVGAPSAQDFELELQALVGQQLAGALFDRLAMIMGKVANGDPMPAAVTVQTQPTPQQAQQNVQQGLGGRPVGGYVDNRQQAQPQSDPWRQPAPEAWQGGGQQQNDPWGVGNAQPGWARGQQQQQQAPPQRQQYQQSQNATQTVEDKYHNKWTYGLPNAPHCAHGQMVQKSGTSREGKQYKGWFCAASGPNWQGPKPPKEQQCEAQFGR